MGTREGELEAQGRNVRVCFPPGPREVSWGQHFAPAAGDTPGSPRSGLRSAPGWRELCPLTVQAPPPLRSPSGTDPACLGGQAAERPRAGSESHRELGQSQGPRLIAQGLHLGISGLPHCASQALIPLCFYLLPSCFRQGHKGIMGPLGPPGPKGEKVGAPSHLGRQEPVPGALWLG